MTQPIILDCDPGHDDAIALVLALASPELEVKAVTSSAGNQTPDKTLRNVLRMLTLLKRTDIPVAGGAVKPLMRELIIADNVHGESGLDGPALPEPGFAAQRCTAVELMAKTLRESPQPVTIVATGPQTSTILSAALAAGYNLQNHLGVSVTSGIMGDDSLDVADTSGVKVGEDYLLSDATDTALVRITAIHSGTRLRLAANLSRNWGATAKLTGSTLVARAEGGVDGAHGRAHAASQHR